MRAGDGGERHEDRIKRTCQVLASVKYVFPPDSLRAQAFGANAPKFKPRPPFCLALKVTVRINAHVC